MEAHLSMPVINTHVGSLDVCGTNGCKATSEVREIPRCPRCWNEMIIASHSIPPGQWVCFCKIGRLETV